VTKFAVGDAVFGGRSGAFAEYVVVPEDRAIAAKPDNVGFDEAAAIPIAAVTALQALRDDGRLQAGEKVLINGASGGVGTYAVQIAKALGAEVHGVCSTRNVEMVRALGADHVFDYKYENYTESDNEYDLIIDMVGGQPVSERQSPRAQTAGAHGAGRRSQGKLDCTAVATIESNDAIAVHRSGDWHDAGCGKR